MVRLEISGFVPLPPCAVLPARDRIYGSRFPSATHFNPYIGLILINGDLSQGSETPAYILSALVSVGGIIGYARTGSIPSITAGLTVGALVSIPPPSTHTPTSVYEAHTEISPVWSRWLPHPK
jgi:Transmembrane proteins 14C